MTSKPWHLPAALAGYLILSFGGSADAQALPNVSYNPTRELYHDINAAFATAWAAQGHGAVSIKTSNGGSRLGQCSRRETGCVQSSAVRDACGSRWGG